MNAPEAVTAFVGIENENEFYSHHYLAEVFRSDIKTQLAAWEDREDAHPGDESARAPYTRLRQLTRDWFALRDRIARERS